MSDEFARRENLMSDEFARRENLAITTAKIDDYSVTTLTTKLNQMLQKAMDENENLRARVAELEAAWEAWEAAWTGAASAEDEAAAWEAAWEAEAAWAEAAKKSQEAELRRVCKELEGK